MSADQIWFNGAFRAAGAVVDATDRGFLLGDGVFESLLLRDGAPVFLGPHLERLQSGCAALAIPAILPERAAIEELARKCGLSDGAVRITVSAGPGGRGVRRGVADNPSVLVQISPMPTRSPSKSVMVAENRLSSRRSDRMYKHLSGYLENGAALRAAVAAGADDAVLLNESGDVACCAFANIFLVDEGGQITTPSLGDGPLPGIVREKIMAICRGEGIVVEEASVPPEKLGRAALFLTNSIIGVQPARLAGAPTPVFAPQADRLISRIASRYEELVSIDASSSGGTA